MSKKKNDKIDTELVEQLRGKTLLVGITYCEPDGTPIEKKQFFGVIEDISSSGVFLRHPKTGEEFSLPPDLSRYSKAAPGQYRLRSTGEIVVNPDLLGAWSITKPAN